MTDFQKYFDMLMVLGECRKHYRNAQDLYAARYPDSQQKSRMAFKRLADRFCRFSTMKQTRVKRRPIVNENNSASILAFVALNPHASSRQKEKKSRGSSLRASSVGRPKPRLVDPLKVIILICFDFSTIFILCVTRMILC